MFEMEENKLTSNAAFMYTLAITGRMTGLEDAYTCGDGVDGECV
jgi:hypothetical protein